VLRRATHERELAEKERELVAWEQGRADVHDRNEAVHRRAMHRHADAAVLHDRIADRLERLAAAKAN